MKEYISTERTDLFEPNVMIAMTFCIDGNPSYEQLEKAAHQAIVANQILHCKVVLGEDGTAWYERTAEQNNKVYRTEQSFEDIVKEQEKIRFQIEKGELLRLLIKQDEHETRVILLAHHLAGDGKSMVYFIEDMMKALSEKTLENKDMRLLPVESFPKNSKMPFYVKVFHRIYNHQWRHVKEVYHIEEIENVHKDYWNAHNCQFLVEEFSEEELNHVVKKARNAHVSLTSYVMTLLCQIQNQKCSIGLAVNGRLDSNRCMGNQTTGTAVDYRYHSAKSFEQNAQKVQKILSNKLNTPWKRFLVLRFMEAFDPTLLDSMFMSIYSGYQNRVSANLAKVLGYGKVKRHYSITNLTKLDIEDTYGTYRIHDFIFLPPIVSYARRLIGMATLGGKMYMTYHLQEDEVSKKELGRFYDIIEQMKK